MQINFCKYHLFTITWTAIKQVGERVAYLFPAHWLHGRLQHRNNTRIYFNRINSHSRELYGLLSAGHSGWSRPFGPPLVKASQGGWPHAFHLSGGFLMSHKPIHLRACTHTHANTHTRTHTHTKNTYQAYITVPEADAIKSQRHRLKYRRNVFHFH